MAIRGVRYGKNEMKCATDVSGQCSHEILSGSLTGRALKLLLLLSADRLLGHPHTHTLIFPYTISCPKQTNIRGHTRTCRQQEKKPLLDTFLFYNSWFLLVVPRQPTFTRLRLDPCPYKEKRLLHLSRTPDRRHTIHDLSMSLALFISPEVRSFLFVPDFGD
jgi:hypothetical protein